MALLRLGRPDAVWPLLAFSPDPRVQAETLYSLAHFGRSRTCSRSGSCASRTFRSEGRDLLALADLALQAPNEPWIGRAVAHAPRLTATTPTRVSTRPRGYSCTAAGGLETFGGSTMGSKAGESAGKGAGLSMAGTRWL